MKVVGRTIACVKIRGLLAAATVVGAACMVLAPVGAAPGEQASYRRLVELESTRTFSDELTAALASRDAGLAGRAALALGRTEDVRAAGPLYNATGSQDVSLRALAVYGYGLLAAKTPISTEVPKRAMVDTSAAVRIAGIDAAWRAQAGKVPGAVALATSLLELAVRDRVPIFMHEQDPMVRWHQAWTLRRAFAALTSVTTIRAGLTDRDETVRIQFADLVARRKDGAEAAWLEPLLADPSWRVREQAIESVKVLAGGQPTQHLTAVPQEVVTPAPAAIDTSVPQPRPAGPGLMDGPMPGPHPRVRIGTTKGTIVVRLYPEWAPLTVANFLNLADRGYYDGLRWFRVVPDFVAQTGDPHDAGEGDAGYTIPAEENPLEQRAGVISMGLNYDDKTNTPIRDSAGTQYYITLSPQLHLDWDFSVYGRVTSGFDVLGRLIESDRMTKVERIADG